MLKDLKLKHLIYTAVKSGLKESKTLFSSACFFVLLTDTDQTVLVFI